MDPIRAATALPPNLTLLEQNSDELRVPQAPPILGEPQLPPNLTVVQAPDADQRRRQASLLVDQYLETHDDPRGAEAKLNSTLMISALTEIPVPEVYRNYEELVREWTGFQTEPESMWKTLQRHWTIGNVGAELGYLLYQKKYGLSDDAEALDRRIEDLRLQMPSPDELRNSLPEQILKATAEFGAQSVSAIPQAAQDALITGGTMAGTAAVAGLPVAATGLGAPIYAATVAGAYVGGVVTGGAVGTFRHIWRIEEGLKWDELVRAGHSPQVANWVSFGVGAVNGAIELLQIGTGIGVATGPATRALRRTAARVLGGDVLDNLATRIATKYGGAIVESALEEALQESSSIIADQFARELDQELNGMTFTRQDALEAQSWFGRIVEDYRDNFQRVQEAAEFGALGGAGLGILGINAREISSNIDQHRRARGEKTYQELADELARRNQAAERQEQVAPRPERIQNVSERASELEAAIRTGASPEKIVELMNTVRDLEALEEAEDTPVTTDREIEGLELEPWQQTRGEFASRRAAADPNGAIPVIENQSLRDTIRRNVPSMTDLEVDGAALIVDLRARALGLSSEQWVERYLAPDVFATDEMSAKIRGDHPTAVTFLEDGRALISASQQTNFGSWVHEMAHVFRRQLSAEQDRRASLWAGQGQWNTAAEEKFAQGFEDYLREGTAPNGELARIYEQFKQWLERVYNAIRQRPGWELSDDIRSVYDELLGDEIFEQRPVTNTDGDGTLFEAAFHGTPHQFEGQFNTEFIGTGEGSQFFGWGIYFTNRRGIADSYRKENLDRSARQAELATYQGKDIDTILAETPTTDVRWGIFDQINRQFESGSALSIEEALDNVQAGLRYQRDIILQGFDRAKRLISEESVDALGRVPGVTPDQVARDLEIRQREFNSSKRALDLTDEHILAVEKLDPDDFEVRRQPQGTVFEVDIDDDAQWLDWYEPISEGQAEMLSKTGLLATGEVEAALRDIGVPDWRGPDDVPVGMTELPARVFPNASAVVLLHQVIGDAHTFELVTNSRAGAGGRSTMTYEQLKNLLMRERQPTGEQVYHDLSEMLGGDRAASLALRELGFAGNRYPTGTLRGAGPQGTGGTNWVVFDPEATVEIRQRTLFEPVREEATRVAASYGKALDELATDVVGLNGLLPHLSEQERAKVKKQNASKITEMFETLPAPEEFAAAALAGQAKRGWYRRSAQALVEIFGAQDAPRFAALLAATSPRTTVEDNLRTAIQIWGDWERRGRPTTRRSIEGLVRRNTTGMVGTYVPNVLRALSSDDPASLTISGPKVDSFAANLRGEVNRVTNDTWMAIFAHINQDALEGTGMNVAGTDPGFSAGYIAFTARVREAAQVATELTGETWTPDEIQETVWSWTKALVELRKSAASSGTTTELVEAGLVTDELINNVPDFAGLFSEGAYATLLEEAGVGRLTPEGRRRIDRRTRAARRAAEGQGQPSTAGFEAEAHLRRAAERIEGRLQGVATLFETAPEEDLHAQSVRQAIESGRYVDDRVLEEYRGTPWADAELEQRAELARESEVFADAEQFTEFGLAMDPVKRSADYYRELYTLARRENAPTRGELRKRFLDNMDKEQLVFHLEMLATDLDGGWATGTHPLIVNNAKRVRAGRAISDAAYNKMMALIRDDPDQYMELFAQVTEDQELLRQIVEADELMTEEQAEIEGLRDANRQLRSTNRRLDASIREHELENRLLYDQKRVAERQVESLAQRAELTQAELREALDLMKLERARDARTARDRARIAREAAAEKLRQVRQELRERAQAKRYFEKLSRRIMRPPTASIHENEAQQIRDIQGRYEVKRSRRIQGLREMLEEQLRGEANTARRAELEAALSVRSLRDLTPDELEQLDIDLENLRELGRSRRKAEVLEDRRLTVELQDAVLTELTGSAERTERGRRGTREADENLRRSLLSGGRWALLHMDRIAPRIGPTANRLLVQRVNEAENGKLNNVNRRNQILYDAMAELEIAPRDLEQVWRHGFTFDQAVGAYILMQNPDGAFTLQAEGGNNIETEVLVDIQDNLPQKWKDYGDRLLEMFSDEDFARIRDVYVRQHGGLLERVQRYFPFRRDGIVRTDLNDEMFDDLDSRGIGLRRYPASYFTKARTHSRNPNVPPLRLDATSIALNGVEKQEHYVNYSPVIRQLHRVFSKDRNIREAIAAKYGEGMLGVIDRYVNNVANPGAQQAMTTMDKISNLIRANFQIASLAYNLVSAAINLPGPLLFLPYSGPGHLISAVGQLGTHPKQLEQFVFERSPQARNRVIDPLWQQLGELSARDQPKNPTARAWWRLSRKVGRAGMVPLQLVDKWTVLIGWKATYDAEMAKTDGNEAAAIARADEAFLVTQPQGATKDLPDMYNSQQLRWFLLFHTPLNAIWNMMDDLYTGRGSRESRVAFTAYTIFALATTGLIIQAMRRKGLPRDEDDELNVGRLALDASSQFLEAVPVVGSNIVETLGGEWYADRGVNILPIVLEAGKAAKAMFDADSSAAQRIGGVRRTLTEGMRLTGAPSVATNRLLRAIGADDDWFGHVDLWELVGGPPEGQRDERGRR